MAKSITEVLGIKYPIIQGAMAWIADAELVAAVSNAGGAGVIAAGGRSTEWVEQEIKKTRELTDKPFGVNVMLMAPNKDEIVEVICREKPAFVTLGAGNPVPFLEKFKNAGVKTVPVVPNVKLAKRIEAAGADAIVVEGMEAGGHIGVLTTMALMTQVIPEVGIPVVMAGGIADGRGLAAALLMGAAGVQMGTRFVLSKECIAHENYKKFVLKARDRSTVVTGRSTGHPVRVLANKLTREFEEMERRGASTEELDKLGVGKLNLATHKGDVENGSVMIGQISGMLNDILPVADIIHNIVEGLPGAVKSAEAHCK